MFTKIRYYTAPDGRMNFEIIKPLFCKPYLRLCTHGLTYDKKTIKLIGDAFRKFLQHSKHEMMHLGKYNWHIWFFKSAEKIDFYLEDWQIKRFKNQPVIRIGCESFTL